MPYQYAEISQQIKELENKTMSYSANFSKEKIQKVLDLEPEEYEDITFEDLINLYERNQKIIQAAQSGLFTRGEISKPMTVRSTEVEQKLQNMTKETLEKAKEISLIEPVVAPKKPEPIAVLKKETKGDEISIEFENKQGDKIELETPKAQKKEIGIEFERERPNDRISSERKVEKPIIPQILAEEEFQPAYAVHTVQTQVQMTLGEGKNDPTAIKKRMLELTKELFKEKGTSRREQIKMEITVLKNMLVPGSKKSESEGEQNRTSIKEGIIKTQKNELTTVKENIVIQKRKEIEDYKKLFSEELSLEENTEKRKKVFDKFVIGLSAIIEKLPGELEARQRKIIAKHREQRNAVGDDMKTEQIETQYMAEFEEIKQMLAKEIDASIDFASQKLYGKAEENMEAIDEINSMDESSLLNYLKTKDSTEYTKYEKSTITKGQAIKSAKRQIAKEKGVSMEKIEKYIGE